MSATSWVSRDTATERLLVDVNGRIARITLNEPSRHNTLSTEMRDALGASLYALEADPDVRVLVVTGAGERAFSAGADISEFREQRTSPEARAEYDRNNPLATEVWAALSKPTIAMIRGYCLGAGLLLALRADIRIAAAGSRFGIPAARIGLGYAVGGVVPLLDVVGPAWAAELLFSARHLDSSEAERIGLVNRVVEPDRLEPQVMELAGMIAANAPLTIAASKATLRELRRDAGRRDLARVDAMVDACFRSEDYLEGQAAFREKREPRFRGR